MPKKPVIVPGTTDADQANKRYGEAYGVDWVYAKKKVKKATNKPTSVEVKIAQKVADRLFKNGFGEKARRLVIEIDDEHTSGGWCKQVVVDHVAQILADSRW